MKKDLNAVKSKVMRDIVDAVHDLEYITSILSIYNSERIGHSGSYMFSTADLKSGNCLHLVVAVNKSIIGLDQPQRVITNSTANILTNNIKNTVALVLNKNKLMPFCNNVSVHPEFSKNERFTVFINISDWVFEDAPVYDKLATTIKYGINSRCPALRCELLDTSFNTTDGSISKYKLKIQNSMYQSDVNVLDVIEYVVKTKVADLYNEGETYIIDININNVEIIRQCFNIDFSVTIKKEVTNE